MATSRSVWPSARLSHRRRIALGPSAPRSLVMLAAFICAVIVTGIAGPAAAQSGPQLGNPQFYVPENYGTIPLSPLAFASDPGLTMSITSATTPSHGSVVITATGQGILYTGNT